MRKKRILVVDDQAIYREPIAMTLDANGYTVVCAEDGNNAIAEMKRNLIPFELILLDYSMPKMNGLEFLEKIREFPDWKEIPVVMLTEMADKELILKLRDLGVHRYILKSAFSLSDLLQVIDKCLKSAPTQAPLSTTSKPAESESKPVQKSNSISLVSTREKTLQCIGNSSALRGFSSVVQEVLAITDAAETNAADLAATLKKDPALAAHVLRIANSAAYGSKRRVISSLTETVGVIGFYEIRNAAVSVAVYDSFTLDKRYRNLLIQIWQHCFAVGKIMELILEENDLRATALLSGIFHGVPDMVLLQEFPEDYKVAALHAEKNDIPFSEVLEQAFGVKRTRLAEETLAALQVPKRVRESIASFFSSERGKLKGVAKILQTAKWFANGLSILPHGGGDIAPIAKTKLDASLIKEANFDDITTDLRTKVITCAQSITSLPLEELQNSTQLFPKSARSILLRCSGSVYPNPVSLFLSSFAEHVRVSDLDSISVCNSDIDVVICSEANEEQFFCKKPSKDDAPLIFLYPKEGALALPQGLGIQSAQYPLSARRLGTLLEQAVEHHTF